MCAPKWRGKCFSKFAVQEVLSHTDDMRDMWLLLKWEKLCFFPIHACDSVWQNIFLTGNYIILNRNVIHLFWSYLFSKLLNSFINSRFSHINIIIIICLISDSKLITSSILASTASSTFQVVSFSNCHSLYFNQY